MKKLTYKIYLTEVSHSTLKPHWNGFINIGKFKSVEEAVKTTMSFLAGQLDKVIGEDKSTEMHKAVCVLVWKNHNKECAQEVSVRTANPDEQKNLS